ncbi:pseudouridylate synthase 7 homolog [Episyrphus balteatus]|uniref:pseudouridylate synthase 7 homolog n=1 Tax=Episyrphus balteatus TaxID=286459 RepID=UPI00248588DD|nr:pseudouridylate synthase 7 homolog [Episyrphus balteatus]
MGRNSHNFKRGGHNNRGNNRGNHRGNSRGNHRGNHRGGGRDNSRNSYGHNKSSYNGPPRTGKPEYLQKVSLKENQVGINEFISAGKGFTGVLKARFSDFHVNEIDLNGTIANLNDYTIPQAKDPDYGISPEELEKCKTEISDVVTEDLWKQIDEIAKGKRTEPLEIVVTELDKDKRTTIHKVIKKLYEMELNSCTVDKPEGVKCIKISQSNRKASRNKWLFPGEFVHFLMYKENMDTSEVAVILANYLNLKPSQVNYCGTKDKRGKTTQKFCIKKRNPSQIVAAVKRSSSIKVGNFTFHDKVVKLGELKGNRFRIALRHIDGDKEEIEKILQNVKEFGFINYYGLQRFGNNAEIPTYQIGIALLKSDYKTACELILKPRDNDVPFMRKIRETWWKDRDSKAAADMFYNDRFIEKKLLNGLAEYGESDYANALRKIPRNMLLLYTHAYQSLIFNRIASKRVKEHGLKLMVGDLVYRNQDELDEIALETDSELPVAVPDQEDGGDGEGDEKENNDDSEKPKEAESSFKQKVKALTEEDIASGKYTVFDVVIPLPGHDITYPANELQQWYEDILNEEGLSSEKLKHGVKTYSLAGAYRKLLIKPENMSWYFKTYNTPQEDIIPSHFEKSTTEEKKEESTNEGQFTALVLDLCLPASVYATMFLREVLKSDTSSSHQAELEKSAMKKFNEKNSSKSEQGEEREKESDKSDEETNSPKVMEIDETKEDSSIVEENNDIEDEKSLPSEKTAEKRPIEEETDDSEVKKAKLSE